MFTLEELKKYMDEGNLNIKDEELEQLKKQMETDANTVEILR